MDVDLSCVENIDIYVQMLVFGYIRKTHPDLPNVICTIILIFFRHEGWIDFQIGDFLDCRDKNGKWYEVQIVRKKAVGLQMPLENERLRRMYELIGENVILISYGSRKKPEWIHVDEEKTICRCRSLCPFSGAEHRLAAPRTQSVWFRRAENERNYEEWAARSKEKNG